MKVLNHSGVSIRNTHSRRLGLRTRPKGAIWVMTMLFLFIVFLFAAIGVDYGNALAIKQQALSVSETSTHAGWVDNFVADYTVLGPMSSGAEWEANNNPYQRPNVSRATISRFPKSPDDFPTDVNDAQNPPYNPAYPEGQSLKTGARIKLFDTNNNEIDPNDTNTKIVPVHQTHEDYIPDIQENNENEEHGDIVYGTWAEDPVTGKFTFTANTQLPNCMRVYVRRTYETRIEGVREGENPIHFLLGRAVTGYYEKDGDTPAQGLNRGMRLQVRSTVVMVPAGSIGKGKVIERPRDPKQDAADPFPTSYRSGIFPMAIRLNTAQAILAQQDPATQTTHTLTVDVAGNTEAFFTTLYDYTAVAPMIGPSFDGTNPVTQFEYVRKSLRFLNQTPSVVPEDLTTNTPHDLSVGGMLYRCDFGNNAAVLQTLLREVQNPGAGHSLINCILTVPVVQNSTTNLYRCVGFMKVFCSDCVATANTITLRIAPSSAGNLCTVLSDAMNLSTQTGDITTNAGSYPDIPIASLVTAGTWATEALQRQAARNVFYDTFWVKTVNPKYQYVDITSGLARQSPYVALKYGVACSTASVRFHNVTEDVEESKHPDF